MMKTMLITTCLVVTLTSSGCSSMRNFLAAGKDQDGPSKPIRNPFGDYHQDEIQQAEGDVSDFVLPAPNSMGASRGPASVGQPMVEEALPAPANDVPPYKEKPATLTDREIVASFPHSMPGGAEDVQKQRDIEQNLGLMPSDDATPDRQGSYLAAIDHVKQLYRAGRYEAGLVEVDGMIRDYPTDPRLHEMRGTLLDRMGRRDMAVKSWNQALRLNPKNESLRRYIGNRAPAGGRSP